MRPRPAFFIICGDLVDAMPNEWPDIRREQEKDFLEIYSKLDPEIPLGKSIVVFLENGHKSFKVIIVEDVKKKFFDLNSYSFSLCLW